MTNHFIKPDWPAPTHIRAYSTLRSAGDVKANREQLKKILNLPTEPIWLKQTHSAIAIPALPENRDEIADASFTSHPKHICLVFTADCLPLLVCNRAGTHVAAIHAGWRGLASGVIENTLKALNLPADDLLVWLGPAIGPTKFEVGEDVHQLFDSESQNMAFHPFNQRWLADIFALARLQLQRLGVTHIYGGEHCTYSNEEWFFSYRRDGNFIGRMASLIYIDA